MLFHLLAKGASNAHSACLRFLLGLALLFISTSGWTQSQEWAYSLGQEALSEPIILTDPSLGTDRLLAANLQYPSGVQDILLTRQDELGAIVWQTRVDIGAKDQIGAMELIPVGPLAGELILVGETDYLSSASAFLCRLDPNATGGPAVVETFIDPFPGGGGSTTEGRYLDLTIRDEGGALRIACAGWMGGSGPGASRSAVVSEFEIGTTGFVRLWSRKLDTNPQVDDHDMASTIVHIPGDGYLIGGTLNGTTGFTLPCGAVHRLNYAGGTEWTARLMGNAGTIAVADLAFLGQNGQVVALSNHTATEAFGIHVLSYADGFLQQAQVFDPNGPHAGLALAGFAMETVDPMGQFLVAGMAKDHVDPDHAGDQNPPFHMLIDVNENGILAGGNLILHEEFATDLGETVSGFSWFGNGTQPFIHHPDMVALGGGNDFVLAAGRSQYLPLSADLDVVPSNWTGDDGASCETLSLVPETIPSDATMEGGSMEGAFDGPLTPTSGITLSVALTPLDCDEITVPPCNLPSLILTSMDLDVVTAAAALAATPDADILFSWDFGDGSAPVSGLGLSSVTHEYDVAGEYTITLTSSCAWDASTTTSIQTTVSFGSGYCIEVEEVILDNDLIPELVPEGLSTYRYYVTCENPGDRVVSLTTPAGSGIFTSTDFWHSQYGGPTPNGLQLGALQLYPELHYDSWLTIGLAGAANPSAGEANISTIQSPDNNWTTNFDPGAGAPGSDVVLNDDIGGGLYTIVGDANQLCGTDQRVLLAQLTTDGSITGDIDVQIIPDGTTQVSLDGSTFDPIGLDLNGDGLGSISDLLVFLGNYGAEASGVEAAADINDNGVLDWDDLTKVLAPNSMHVELELDPPCEASSVVETCYPFFPTDLDFNFSMACDPQWALVRFPDKLYDLSESQLDCYVQIRGGLGETENIRINLDPSTFSMSEFGGFFRGRIIPLDWPRISDGSPTTWGYTAELKFYQEGAYEEGLDPCHVIEKTDYCSSGVGPLWYARELLPSLSVDLNACAASASPLPPFVESRGLTYRIDGLPDGVSEAQFMSAFEAGEDLSPYGAPLDSVELQPGITPLDCGGYGYEMVTSRPVFTIQPGAAGAEDSYTEVATGEVFSASEFEAVPRAIAIEDPRIQLQALLVQPPTGSNDLTLGGPFGPFSALPGFGDDCADLTEVSLGGQAIAVNPLLYAGGVNDWGDLSVHPDVGHNGISPCVGHNGIYPDTGHNGIFPCVGHNGITLLDSLVYDDQGLLTLGQLAPGETLSLINTGETNECPSQPVVLATFSASIGSPSSVGGTNGIEGPCPPDYDCQGIGLTASTVGSIEDTGSDDYDVNDVVVQLQLDVAANAGPLSWSITNVENEVVATGQTAAGDSGGPLTLTLPGGSYTLDVDASCGAYTPQLSLSSGTAMQYGIPTQLLPVSLAPTIGPASFSFTLPGGLGIPLGSSWSATGCNAAFDHSSMPFGTYTPPPGTVIGQEDNIKLSMEVFNDGSGNIYNFGFIAMAPTGPLSGKAFQTSNVNAVYDLSAFPNVTEVSFDFYDGAGVENLRVNGATWLIDEFELMAPGVAPGVSMSVTTTNFAGYQTGTVTLTGNVQELWVGGQQFSVDNLCVKHDGTIVTATGPVCPDQCEGGSDFDALPFGEKYGDLPSGATTFVAIGDVAFDADGIPVSLYELTSSSGFLGYQYAHVDGPQAAYGFGGGNTLELRNVTASFDIASVYPETDTLCLHFLDEGGYENLSINGSTLTITANGKGGLAALDGTSLGGVDIAVSGTPFTTSSGTPVAYAGTLSLIGDVDELVIGGQEFWIDNLCISGTGNLADAVETLGTDALADMLGVSIEQDTSLCEVTVSFDPAEDFPPHYSADIQFIGIETGNVYETFVLNSPISNAIELDLSMPIFETVILEVILYGWDFGGNDYSAALSGSETIEPCFCSGGLQIEVSANFQTVDATTWESINSWSDGTLGFGGFEEAGHISWSSFCLVPPWPGDDAPTTFNVAVTMLEGMGDCGEWYEVLFTAYNCCGADDGYIIYHVPDEEPPVIELTCPSDTTISFDMVLAIEGGCAVDPVVSGMAEFSVNDEGCESVTGSTLFSDMVVDADGNPLTDVDCFLGGYTILRTWTATYTDCCGNTASASCTQAIEVSSTTLGGAAVVLGESGLLQLIDYELAFDSVPCYPEFLYDLGDLGGLVSSVYLVLYDENGQIAATVEDNGDMTFSIWTPITLPNINEGLPTSSISYYDVEMVLVGNTVIPDTVSIIPGIVVPICPIEPDCIALADFVHLDNGDCTSDFVYTGTSGNLEWTIDGVAQGSNSVVFSSSFTPGLYNVCVTVTDFDDPECTDTACQLIAVNCGGTDQVDSCDVEFTHEFAPFTGLGAVTIPGPNVVVATEDNIDLSFEDITYVDGSTNFGSAEIMAAQPEAGNGQVLWLNNISAVYDLTGVAAVEQVKFEFIDYGGLENLRINGSLLVDDIDNMGGALGGVNVLVTYNTYFGFIAGEVILTGNVQELAVAGQEFYIDNVCVITGDEEECADTDADGICDEDEVAGCTDPAAINYDPNATDDDGSCDNGNDNANDTTEVITNFAGSCPSSCDWLVDFGSQPLGTSWGDPASGPTFPLAPGSFMFNEGGVDMYVDALSSSLYGSYYNQNIITTSPWPTFGMGQVLHTNNATVTFDLDSIPTDSVCLDILDLGGFEYLEVNGVGFSSMNGYGQLIAAPMNMGGVQVQVMGNPIVTTTSAGPMVTGFNGRLVLHGNVYKLRIGGQEFWIDNLCISSPPPPPSLPEFVDNEGQDALLDMLDANVETDTSSCVMAVSLDLTDQALPTADEIQVQLIGMETGTVYNSITVEDGGLDLDFTPEQPIAAQMPHMVTFDGLSLVNIPETTDGEMMLVSIVLTEGDFVIDLTIPGIFVPGCGGGIVDIPCDVDATFAALETPCGVITVIAAPEPSAVETWSLNGAPYVPIGDPHAFTLTLADGVHTLCRTVTSLLFPNCSDTYCHTFAVDCAVDSCDYSFTHESMTYGPVNSMMTYTEDHIDLHFAPFDDGLGGGPTLGNAYIDYAIPGIGTNQVLLLSNINADYNLTNLVNVSRVTFDYFDGAGIENLMVNGDFIINEFGSLYGSTFTLGGVDVFITRLSTTTYSHGEVILTGNVQSFAVGGQQFYVDDICVTADGVICTTDSDQDGVCDEDEVAGCTDATAGNYDASATDEDGSCQYYATTDSTEIVIAAGSPCPAECNALVDFESQMLGVSWGDPTFGATIAAGPSDLMFNESGVDVFIDELFNTTTGYVGFIKNEITTSPWAAFGSGNVMHTNNAVATFELEAIPTDSVCLDFLDFGGFESLTVNGDRYESPNGYGELTGAPAVLGGVTVQVIGSPIIQMTSTGLQPVGFNGRIVLYGNVNKLEIGGQEFWIDNLCISEGEATAPEVPGCTYEEALNYAEDANTDDGSCILPEVNPCPTDIDADGTTDTADLLLLLGSYSLTCDE